MLASVGMADIQFRSRYKRLRKLIKIMAALSEPKANP